MFNKVLVANRGAIAVRVIRSLASMGISSVAVYAESDRDSLHVTQADEAFCLGNGAASDTYLMQAKIIEIANSCGAQAIHPGYGFLSENPDFVELCETNGIAFIGPTPDQIKAFGLKHTARNIAKSCDIPMLSGTDVLASCDEAMIAAENIGYPVMLKSSAGGGGIGMQICRSCDELKKAYESVKRLSANNFSNDAVFLEKYIEVARHIEVQIFGDGAGNAVAFGERDCSAQRRHQKVIEETPAPNLSDDVRKALAKTAVNLVSSVNYRNAGTVEFIYDSQCEQFYFLEVNTRLQVEHGVTEQVFGVDLVEWMVKLADGSLGDINALRKNYSAKGHSIQARIYAENPARDFQPSAGVLSVVDFPETGGKSLRIDTWIEPGIEISPFFDPMLAKVISWANNRDDAISTLTDALNKCTLQGIETNTEYAQNILQADIFTKGEMFTRFLNSFDYTPNTVDVISPGTLTTLQDFPGRTGYWDVGVPPSGPFDNVSFRLANRLLNNPADAVALEITLNGPTLKFNRQTYIALCGASTNATLDGTAIDLHSVVPVASGQILKIGKTTSAGARAYLAIAGGFQADNYLGSGSTFTLGKFGGFAGRALRTGDVLHAALSTPINIKLESITPPAISNEWILHTIYGPHGAPDFFTKKDIETFFNAEWTVHYNSSRTGVRLIGPKPEWARETGGEAGMHPSNIHDNAYAVGTVDFTGDMPVILGPDGPSLGGFVCPATVITADLWKLGQLKAGDKIRFALVSQAEAARVEIAQTANIENLDVTPIAVDTFKEIPETPILHQLLEQEDGVCVVYRPSGDKYLLVEYGPKELDLRMRFRVQALLEWLQKRNISGILELTPGIRSLQVHFDSLVLSQAALLELLLSAESEFSAMDDFRVPSRIVHIPLSWDDAACKLAIEKYQQSVRKDAPWCPSNIEFIRRINGLDSIDDVKKIVFDASYVVMGLGDVYLGAPVATPLDPRHRLVTTKYNPARTWTAENSVGIGGAYMCIYGMEGPGGYQFIGRTLQMWNRYKKTREFDKPWLLRFFDQVRFYEVSAGELVTIREDFPRGQYPLKIESTTFSLKEYEAFLRENETSSKEFSQLRQAAFDEELQRWVESGQINFESQTEQEVTSEPETFGENAEVIESSVTGNIWQWTVSEGDAVEKGQVICILESMKMEIEVYASVSGKVVKIFRQQGQQIQAGQSLIVLEEG